MLADEESKRVYASILNFKISGNMQYLLDVVTPKAEIYRKIIHLTPNEVYVDLGAYNGDTIQEVLQFTHEKYIRIYAMEPDRKTSRSFARALTGCTMFMPTMQWLGVQIPLCHLRQRQAGSQR